MWLVVICWRYKTFYHDSVSKLNSIFFHQPPLCFVGYWCKSGWIKCSSDKIGLLFRFLTSGCGQWMWSCQKSFLIGYSILTQCAIILYLILGCDVFCRFVFMTLKTALMRKKPSLSQKQKMKVIYSVIVERYLLHSTSISPLLSWYFQNHDICA
jgi:hypothetical protein